MKACGDVYDRATRKFSTGVRKWLPPAQYTKRESVKEYTEYKPSQRGTAFPLIIMQAYALRKIYTVLP